MSSLIADRLADVRERIAAAARGVARDPASVTLVAVSKRKPADAVRAAYAAGQRDFGENYVQEMVGKQEELTADAPDALWHYIGPLQRNKVRHVVGRAVLLHAIDADRLLDEIDRRSRSGGVTTAVLLQVNVAREATKSGCDGTTLPALARHALTLSGVRLRGLMTMPPFFPDPEDARPYFRRLRELRDALVADHGVPPERVAHLSMGMSHDFEVAIEEGATLVRVGSDIFGARD